MALAAGGRVSPPLPLTGAHELSGFDCGVPALDDWLRRRALRNEGPGSRTYVLLQGTAVMAFYSLSLGSVARDAAPGAMRRNMPDPLPVMVLGRLAVHRDRAGQGLGSDLLRDALIRTARVSAVAGTAGLLVNAKDEAAAKFYERYGFLRCPGEAPTLAMPLRDILQACAEAGVALPD